MKKVLGMLLVMMLVMSMVLVGCAPKQEAAPAAPADQGQEDAANSNEALSGDTEEPLDTSGDEGGYTIGVVTKIAGNPFYDACLKGLEEAAAENGDTVIMQGPSDATAELQIELINNFIAQKVDCILVAANDPDALAPSLKKAVDKGIVVVSFDSDVAADARTVFVNPADPRQTAISQVKGAKALTGGEGKIAILSAAATATNQNAWIEFMKEELEKDEYAGLELVTVVYGDDKADKSYQEANGLFKSYSDLKCIISPTSVGIVATGKAITDAGLIGEVYLTGLGLPSEMAEYIENGAAPAVYLWNPVLLGYVSQHVAHAVLAGDLTGEVGEEVSVGNEGTRSVTENAAGTNEIILGDLFEFNQENISEWKSVF